jgi:hypothetical protein
MATGGTLDASLQPMASLSLGDNPTFGFKTIQWIEPPLFDPKSPETDDERYVRVSTEND